MESSSDLETANLSDWFRLMKPGVLALLQVTAMCTILIHDLIVWNAAGGLDFDIFPGFVFCFSISLDFPR